MAPIPCPVQSRAARACRQGGGSRKSAGVHQAFILGAGLGTRLRPLTDHLPKPLVPLFHRPLAWWTIQSCRRLGIGRFAINTHHLPEKWDDFLRMPEVRGLDISLFHEPVLMETGGGLKNIEPWAGGKPLLVHNGDIFTTMPLERLIAAHEASGLPVTLALRSSGPEKRIALDATGTRVADVRGELGVSPGSHVFSGIYCVDPGFFALLPPAEIIPVIPAFLELAAAGCLGAAVIDDGVWLDLGDRDSYLAAHRTLALDAPVHPAAQVHPEAQLEGSVIGPDAVIGSGSVLRDCVVWPGARVEPGARLDGCIVCGTSPVGGGHRGEDL